MDGIDRWRGRFGELLGERPVDSRVWRVGVSFGNSVQEELREPERALRSAIPEVYEGHRRLQAAAFAPGVLDVKTKELIALAIAVTSQCDGCIAAHARRAVRRGAGEEEVAEAIGVAIAMSGGPGAVYGPRAFSAFQEFTAALGAKRKSAPAGGGAGRSHPPDDATHRHTRA